MRRFVSSFAVIVNLLLLDQIVKAWAMQRLKGGAAIPVSPFFNLAYVENRGCAWGMLQGHVWPLAAFAAVVFALLLWKRRSVFPPGRFGFATETLLYAGILGNLIDRLYYGFVVDMFDFHWGVRHFPCFNVADSCITIAAAMLMVASVLVRDPSERDRGKIDSAMGKKAKAKEAGDAQGGD